MLSGIVRNSPTLLRSADILNDPGVRDAILDGALFHAGVPILVDPVRSLSWDKNSVLIAWSDAPETAAAVRRAFHF